jgi:hypothetical protein
VAGAGHARLLPALTEMERALGDVGRGALARRTTRRPTARRRRAGVARRAVGQLAHAGFLGVEHDDLAFGFKGGLAATICHCSRTGSLAGQQHQRLDVSSSSRSRAMGR